MSTIALGSEFKSNIIRVQTIHSSGGITGTGSVGSGFVIAPGIAISAVHVFWDNSAGYASQNNLPSASLAAYVVATGGFEGPPDSGGFFTNLGGTLSVAQVQSAVVYNAQGSFNPVPINLDMISGDFAIVKSTQAFVAPAYTVGIGVYLGTPTGLSQS